MGVWENCTVVQKRKDIVDIPRVHDHVHRNMDQHLSSSLRYRYHSFSRCFMLLLQVVPYNTDIILCRLILFRVRTPLSHHGVTAGLPRRVASVMTDV